MKNNTYAMFAVMIVAVMMLPGVVHAVDGVILINQASALAGGVTEGDAPGFPVTISQPGSYRLSSNLNVPGRDINGIEIRANGVTIDLNGFSIRGNARSGTGIFAPAAPRPALGFVAIVVRNGTISNFETGIDLGSSAQSIVENINAHENGITGIEVGSNSIVRGNTAVRNGTFGITATKNSTVIGNNASQNGVTGIKVNDEIEQVGNSTVSGNTASQNGTFGITVGINSTVSGNTASQNGSGGLNVFCPGNVIGNTAVPNIFTEGACTRANNNPAP